MAQWWNSQQQWQDRSPLPRRKPTQYQPKKPKDQSELYAYGFDGKRLKIPREDQGGSGGSTSLPSSSTSAKEMAELKSMMRQIVSGETAQLSEAQLKMLQSSPRDAMREKQKELNRQRKVYNKEKTLESRLQLNEEKFQGWLQTQRTLIKTEKERFEAEQNRLRRDLEKLQAADQDEGNMEDDEDAELFAPPAASHDVMNQRVQAAEKAAYDAQNAMLMMQQQLHQLRYTQQTAATNGPASAEAVPFATDAAPLAATSPAPHHVHPSSAGSPQLPKGVRNGTLKTKGDKEKTKERHAAQKDNDNVIDLEGTSTPTGVL